MMNNYICFLLIIFSIIFLFYSCKDIDSAGETKDIYMCTPYFGSNDLDGIHRTFSSLEGATSSPWGVAHPGLDLIPNRNLIPLQAVCTGTVESIRLWQNDITSTWQVNVRIKYNKVFSVDYAFEPVSTAELDGNKQLERIFVTVGQKVTQGDTIGLLWAPCGASHVHFMLMKNYIAICPEPYFIPSARDSIINLIRRDHPDWDMCY